MTVLTGDLLHQWARECLGPIEWPHPIKVTGNSEIGFLVIMHVGERVIVVDDCAKSEQLQAVLNARAQAWLPFAPAPSIEVRVRRGTLNLFTLWLDPEPVVVPPEPEPPARIDPMPGRKTGDPTCPACHFPLATNPAWQRQHPDGDGHHPRCTNALESRRRR